LGKGVSFKSENGGQVPAHQTTEGSKFMRERGLTIPEIMLIGGTRVALGVGLGLLIADRLTHDTRKGAGWALLAVGALSSIPLVIDVLGKPDLPQRALTDG
jgi:hypothetical protein